MDHTLIPTFKLRVSGVIVNDVPKTHCEDPAVDDHCVSFEHSVLCIPLQLNGEFSYFQTRLPNERELHECEKVFLTPDSSDWNPQCPSYKRNERQMLDFEGNISEPSRRSKYQIVFEDEDDEMIDLASDMVSVSESDWEANIDANVSTECPVPLSIAAFKSQF